MIELPDYVETEITNVSFCVGDFKPCLFALSGSDELSNMALPCIYYRHRQLQAIIILNLLVFNPLVILSTMSPWGPKAYF